MSSTTLTCPICEEKSQNMIPACNSCNTLICATCHDLSNSRIKNKVF